MDEDDGYMGKPLPTGHGSRLTSSIKASKRGIIGAASSRGGAGSKAAAGQQGSGSEPVAADTMYDAALMSSLAHTPLRGRFYSPEALRFTDEAKVLEVTYPVLYKHFTSSSSSSGGGDGDGQGAEGAKQGVSQPGARPPPMLRVLGVYYGSQQQLFEKQLQRFKYDKWIPLVGVYPTFGDYCRTLEAAIDITGEPATPGAFAHNMVGSICVLATDLCRFLHQEPGSDAPLASGSPAVQKWLTNRLGHASGAQQPACSQAAHRLWAQ